MGEQALSSNECLIKCRRGEKENEKTTVTERLNECGQVHAESDDIQAATGSEPHSENYRYRLAATKKQGRKRNTKGSLLMRRRNPDVKQVRNVLCTCK